VSSRSPIAVTDVSVSIPARVLRCHLWTPQLQSPEAVASWIAAGRKVSDELFLGDALPDVAFLPIPLRKRLGLISRITIAVAHACLKDLADPCIPIVFTSRLGESRVAAELLNLIAKRDSMSPAGFARSVHNTAIGLFSIAQGNQTTATALAAGCESFSQGFLETGMQLMEAPETPRLLVYAEEVLPPEFQNYCDHPGGSFGMGFLLAYDADAQLSVGRQEWFPAELISV
jgi:hypothetical protein